VYFFTNRSETPPETFTAKMKRKIDSLVARHIYSQGLGTVEPVFANICGTLGLKRFSLRSKAKVDAQWKLFCIVHSLLKIHRYGPGSHRKLAGAKGVQRSSPKRSQGEIATARETPTAR
jgi:hypothetical protein